MLRSVIPTLCVFALARCAFVLREMVNRSSIKESEVTYMRAGGSPNRFRNQKAFGSK